MADDEEEAIHDPDTKFYVIYLETVILSETPSGPGLQSCVHWYIGDQDYSSNPFQFADNAGSFTLNNCGFVVVPDKALAADPEANQLTLSITSWQGDHLGVFFGNVSDIADSESFEKHSIDLLNEDGIFAKVDLHAACQTRWTMQKTSHDVACFVDPEQDQQAKYIWNFIAAGNNNWKGNKVAAVESSGPQGEEPKAETIQEEEQEQQPASYERESVDDNKKKATVVEEEDEENGAQRKSSTEIDGQDQDDTSKERASSRKKSTKKSVTSSTTTKGRASSTRKSQSPRTSKKSPDSQRSSTDNRKSSARNKSGISSQAIEQQASGDSESESKDFSPAERKSRSSKKSIRPKSSTNVRTSTRKSSNSGSPGPGGSKSCKSSRLQKTPRENGSGNKKTSDTVFRLDNDRVDNLRGWTEKLFSQQGMIMCLIHPKTGSSKEINLRVVEVSNRALLQIARQKDIDGERYDRHLKTIDLAECQKVFLGHNIDDDCLISLGLNTAEHCLTELCVTVQISKDHEFLTFLFLIREDVMAHPRQGQIGNRSENMIDFIEILRCYSHVTKNLGASGSGPGSDQGSYSKNLLLTQDRQSILHMCNSAARRAELHREEQKNKEIFAEVAGNAQLSREKSPGCQSGSGGNLNGTGLSYSQSYHVKGTSQAYEERLKNRLATLPEHALPEAARQYFVLKIKNNGSDDMISVLKNIDDWCFEFLGCLDSALSDGQNDTLIMLNQELRHVASVDTKQIGDAARRFLENLLGLAPTPEVPHITIDSEGHVKSPEKETVEIGEKHESDNVVKPTTETTEKLFSARTNFNKSQSQSQNKNNYMTSIQKEIRSENEYRRTNTAKGGNVPPTSGISVIPTFSSTDAKIQATLAGLAANNATVNKDVDNQTDKNIDDNPTTTHEIATYRVCRDGVSVLLKPVFGEQIVFTGVKLSKGSLVVVDMKLEIDSLCYLRLIDQSGWLINDSKINPVSPSLELRCLGATIPMASEESKKVGSSILQNNRMNPLMQSFTESLVASNRNQPITDFNSQVNNNQNQNLSTQTGLLDHQHLNSEFEVGPEYLPSLSTPQLGAGLLLKNGAGGGMATKYGVRPGRNGNPLMM